MKLVLFLCFLTLWGSGYCDKEAKKEKKSEPQKSQSQVDGVKALVSNTVDSVLSTMSFLKNSPNSNCLKPPRECPNENITFWYYSRSNPNDGIEVSISNYSSIKNLPSNEHPWKLLIHGYGKSKDKLPNPQIRSAFFEKGDYNVLVLDYSPIAKDGCYVQAVGNVPLIANCTAQLIDSLMDRSLFRSENLHVIGYSLGAHIAGALYEYSRHVKPHRITGLDPAASLFDGVVNEKLSPKSAEFVDVIHTNALMKGKLEKLGHADFYVNGGIHQSGCGAESKDTYSECSHERSVLYFAESINSKTGFYGLPCDSYMKFYSGFCDTTEDKLVLMGENSHYLVRGTFYLETAGKSPFALGRRPNVISLAQRMKSSVKQTGEKIKIEITNTH